MQPKPLCDWTRTEMKQEKALMLEIKLGPQYECRKCRRWASKACWLCEPTKLSQPGVKTTAA